MAAATRWAMALLGALSLLMAGHQPSSHADTPNFPDLGGYTPVNPQDYTIALPNPGRAPTERVYFLTPDGLPCSFAPGVVGIAGGAGCTATHFPGAKDEGPYTTIDTTTGLRASSSTGFVDGAVQGHKLRVLPPFHSITVDGMVCGVDDTGTTACKDAQGRGFVLSPQASGWLPKV